MARTAARTHRVAGHRRQRQHRDPQPPGHGDRQLRLRVLDLGSGLRAGNTGLRRTNATTVGVKFTSDTFGTIQGIKFYKSAQNTGTQWGSCGRRRASCWPRPTSTRPPRRRRAGSRWRLPPRCRSIRTPPMWPATSRRRALRRGRRGAGAQPAAGGTPSNADSPPLHAVRNTTANPNGVLANGSNSPSFPTTGDVNPGGDNYAVDVSFLAQPAPGPVTAVSATAGFSSATLTWNAPTSGGGDHVHHHPLCGHGGPDADHGDGHPGTDECHGHRADERHHLYVHGDGVQPGRHGGGLPRQRPGHPEHQRPAGVCAAGQRHSPWSPRPPACR